MTNPSNSLSPGALRLTEELLERSGVVMTIEGELDIARPQGSARV